MRDSSENYMKLQKQAKLEAREQYSQHNIAILNRLRVYT